MRTTFISEDRNHSCSTQTLTFHLELSPDERQLALEEETGFAPLSVQWCMGHTLGDKNMLIEQKNLWLEKFPSGHRDRFPWLSRDAYLALEEMVGKKFIPPFDRNFHLKPFWQKVGNGFLSWDIERSVYKYEERDKVVFIEKDEYPYLDEPIAKHCIAVISLIENPILKRSKAVSISKRISELLREGEPVKPFLLKELEAADEKWSSQWRWKVLGLMEKIRYC